MKSQNPRYRDDILQAGYPASRQSGFFDLGLALLILAVSGVSVYGIETNRAESAESAAASDTAAIVKTGREQPDPILASFERDLNHEPASTATPGTRQVDPVAALVRRTLLEKDPE